MRIVEMHIEIRQHFWDLSYSCLNVASVSFSCLQKSLCEIEFKSMCSRYSWKHQHSSPKKHHSPNRNSSSPQTILGHFMCPFCHHMTLMYNGGREAILSSFPLDPMILNKSTLNKSKTAKYVFFSHNLLLR